MIFPGLVQSVEHGDSSSHVVQCVCTIQIKSTHLQVFSNMFAHHNRQTALVSIDFDVVLPAYSDNQCAWFENVQDKQWNNEALTDAVHSLFSILYSYHKEPEILGSGIVDYQ